mgnify:CR=1 FL=1
MQIDVTNAKEAGRKGHIHDSVLAEFRVARAGRMRREIQQSF